MYPNLFYLFKDLFGIEIPFFQFINTFGLLVAIAFLAAFRVMSAELKRKTEEGWLKPWKQKVIKGKPAPITDYITNGLMGFVLGYKMVFLALNASKTNNPQDLIFSLEGNFLAGLAIAAIFIYLRYRESEKEKLPQPKEIEETVQPFQIMSSLLVYTAIFGFLGANVFDTLEHLGDIDWKNFSISDLFSGLTFYGGLICGGATVYIISSRKGIHWKHISDVAAPAMMLAYGIGRLGCHFSGDGDWGIANLSGTPAALSFLPDWFFAYNYPNNVANMGELIPGCTGPYCMQLVPPVYPTPLYEALVCVSLFFVLWGLRKKIKTPGILFAIYLIFNGLERFFVEKIRHNPELAIGFTQAEMISFTLILLGFFGLYYFNKTKSEPQKV